jgi:hypothetical protein
MLDDLCSRFIGGFHGLSRWPGDWTPVGTRATRVSAGKSDIFAHRDFEGSPGLAETPPCWQGQHAARERRSYAIKHKVYNYQ